MQKIEPKVTQMDIVCAEIPASPVALVVFGASGDLTKRKLIPALFELYQRELLSENFYVIGCGRRQLSDKQFRKVVTEAIGTEADEFSKKFHFETGGYDEPDFYKRLTNRLEQLNKQYSIDNNVIFYLSVPPALYPVIAEQLGSAGLTCPKDNTQKENVRLIIEKPFGRDLQSAAELNSIITKCFDESQIYRIDHYLGKETVQNIMILRFANAIYEPIWNRDYIDHVQITIAESVGIEHRGGYYDKSGALRDMFQNHMLQMLALVAMEPPSSFEANCIRDEKVKLLKSLRPFEPSDFIRAQYTNGVIDGENVSSYLEEEGVAPDSQTETYIATKILVDNWRWQDVPFYVRTGKRLGAKNTNIAITFKKVPHSMFASFGLDELPSNILVLQIQPQEGISFQFQAKRPGSKMCMGTLDMHFHYSELFDVKMPEAYSRLLLDAMTGDQTLFNRYDSLETAWKLLDPVLADWQNNNSTLYKYPAGAESFAEADKLIESDGRNWRAIANH